MSEPDLIERLAEAALADPSPAARVAAAEHAVCDALLSMRRAEADDAALWARIKAADPDGGPSPSPFVYVPVAEAQDAVRASRDRVRAAKTAVDASVAALYGLYGLGGGRVACPTCGGTEGVVLGMPGGVSCQRCMTGTCAAPDPDPASADHRIAEAAREWARALRAWRRQCDDVIAYEAADLELSALRRAEGALFDALVEEGSK